jgi:uncharacterized protein (DUF1499 family)
MELETMNEEQILEEAVKQGFNPEYEGENKKTPKEFLEVAFNHNKVLKERNDKLSQQVQSLTTQIKHLVQFQEEQKQKAVEKAVRELQAQRQEAIKDGDVEKVEKIDHEIAETQVAKSQNNPILDEWVAKNSWYQDDEELALEADIIAKQLQDTGRFGPQDFNRLLTTVENRIKKAFPDKFRNPKKDNPPDVESGRSTNQSQSKHTYADLPPEAKRWCDQFVKDKIMTREQYLETYEWD